MSGGEGMLGGTCAIKIEPVSSLSSCLRGNIKSEKVKKLQSIFVPRGELGLVNKSWAELPPPGRQPAVSAVTMRLGGQSNSGISSYNAT